jgi:uncharacterized protein (TIGR02266 family)
MFELASEETYENGQVIFQEGSSGDWICTVLSGSVEISKLVEGKRVIVATLSVGEVFGELSFFGAVKRTATARAVGRTTIGIIDRASLDSEFNKLSSGFRAILVASIERYQKLLERATSFSSRSEPRAQKTYSLSYKDRKAFLKAYTANVSTGGLFILTDNPLPEGEQFTLHLQLPGLPEPLKIKSKVSWTRSEKRGGETKPPGMGVAFTEMSDKDYQLMKKYLQDAP